MKRIKKRMFYSGSLLAVAISLLAIPASGLFAADKRENLLEGPQSYADLTGLYMSVDVDGNVKYIEPEAIDIQDELALPEKEDKDTKFDLRQQIGDEEPQVISSYDTFEEANAALNRQSKFRGVGTMGVYTDNQLRSVTNGVVNFNTKGNVLTYYTEDGTGSAGYTNGAYGADGAFLGLNTDGTKVKFKMSGVIGWVNKSDVQILNFDTNDVLSVNFYRVEAGRMLHYITTNVSKNTYSSVYDVGPAQSYMREGVAYYSYDGHYFYESYASMVLDYKTNTTVYPRSINPSTPYYNYFQFLSHRSKTNFAGSAIDNHVNANVGSARSALKNQGASYISAQNTYGVNALLTFGLSVNESGWGKSDYALNRNNIFGHAAFDSNPNNATYYPSVQESIRQHAQSYVSISYTDPNDVSGLYHGAHLGDKASGMNVKYASDPYWGEKAATQGFAVERANGNKNIDLNKYTIGIKKPGIDLTVRKEPSTSSTALYKTGPWNGYPFVVLETVQGENVNGNTKWYKIQTDAPLSSDRSKTLQFLIGNGGEYGFANDYAYISASYVDLVTEGTGGESGGETPPTPPTPTYKKGDVNSDGKISSMDYVLVKNHILNIAKLSGTAAKAADVNGDGKISSMDYVLIKNDILGISKIN